MAAQIYLPPVEQISGTAAGDRGGTWVRQLDEQL